MQCGYASKLFLTFEEVWDPHYLYISKYIYKAKRIEREFSARTGVHERVLRYTDDIFSLIERDLYLTLNSSIGQEVQYNCCADPVLLLCDELFTRRGKP